MSQECFNTPQKKNNSFEKSIEKKMTHKVYDEHTFLKEFENNSELIGGAFADLLSLGFMRINLVKWVHYPVSWYGLGFYHTTEDLQNTHHSTFFIFNQKIRRVTNFRLSMSV